MSAEALGKAALLGSRKAQALIQRPSLTPTALAAARFIAESAEPVMGKQVAAAAGCKLASFNTHCVPMLKTEWGLKNVRGEGYSFPKTSPIYNLF